MEEKYKKDNIRFLLNVCHLKRQYVFLFEILVPFLVNIPIKATAITFGKKVTKFQKLDKIVLHVFCKIECEKFKYIYLCDCFQCVTFQSHVLKKRKLFSIDIAIFYIYRAYITNNYSWFNLKAFFFSEIQLD